MEDEENMKLYGKELMFLGRPISKERCFNIWWLFNYFQGLGSGMINRLRLTEYGPLIGILLIMFPSVPKIYGVFFIMFWLLITILLGVYLKNIGLVKFENEKNSTYETNPYERRMEQRLVNIEEALNIKAKYDYGDDYDKRRMRGVEP